MSMHSLSPPPTAVNPPMRDTAPLAVDPITAARGQQAEEQVAALANIVTAILAARRGETPLRVTELQPEEARRLLEHARRALAERDPIKVGVAHHRGRVALVLALQATLGRALITEEREACVVAFHAALSAYQASLEGHMGEPKADELPAKPTFPPNRIFKGEKEVKPKGGAS